jgi:hypothetical protein
MILSALPKQAFLGLHTARQMHASQLLGIAERKSREQIVSRLPVDFDRFYERRVPADPATRLGPVSENTATLREALDDTTTAQFRTRAEQAAAGTPTFLNRTLRVTDGAGVDWYDDRFDEMPLLWALKLYAFQPLFWLCESYEPGTEPATDHQAAFDGWIRDWTDTVEIGRQQYLRRAWTPWAVSLRILHLSRYLAWRTESGDGDFERRLGREIYKNALFLDNHIEYDVGGNHLIENGAAMVVAGLVFDEQGWIDTGTKILTEAADSQFLDDGYHFERSPMYHVLVTTRYLTVCDLLDRSGRPVPDELQTTAEDATTFLEYLRPPDGTIPLLNDSVYGQALPLDDCLAYAHAIGFGTADQQSRPPGVEPQESGYYWLRTDAGGLLVDGGPVGPPHLPGHSHSDTLSFLLWLDDQPVVTDTGTFGYVSESRRNYARGVRGHNTVQVGDTEPIALGGKYLMGPRPEPTTRFDAGAVSIFEGRYEAVPYGSDPYQHHRGIYAGDSWWLVRDTVSDHDGRPTRGRLQLHPTVTPTLEPTGRVRLDVGETDGTAFVYPLDRTKISITNGPYFPRFGEAISRPVLELSGETTDPATLGVLVSPADVETLAVETDDEGARLRIGSDDYLLPNRQL